jgi:toxin ParE1/3/4
MPEFQLTRKAMADLKDIARYTQSRWGREQRNTYLGQLDESFHALAHDPAKGKESSHIREGYRRYLPSLSGWG